MAFGWYSTVIIEEAQAFSLNLFAFISAEKFITVFESVCIRPMVSDARDDIFFKFDVSLSFSSFSISLHEYLTVA